MRRVRRENGPHRPAKLVGMILLAPCEVSRALLRFDAQMLLIPRHQPLRVARLEKNAADSCDTFHRWEMSLDWKIKLTSDFNAKPPNRQVARRKTRSQMRLDLLASPRLGGFALQ